MNKIVTFPPLTPSEHDFLLSISSTKSNSFYQTWLTWNQAVLAHNNQIFTPSELVHLWELRQDIIKNEAYIIRKNRLFFPWYHSLRLEQDEFLLKNIFLLFENHQDYLISNAKYFSKPNPEKKTAFRLISIKPKHLTILLYALNQLTPLEQKGALPMQNIYLYHLVQNHQEKSFILPKSFSNFMKKELLRKNCYFNIHDWAKKYLFNEELSWIRYQKITQIEYQTQNCYSLTQWLDHPWPSKLHEHYNQFTIEKLMLHEGLKLSSNFFSSSIHAFIKDQINDFCTRYFKWLEQIDFVIRDGYKLLEESNLSKFRHLILEKIGKMESFIKEFSISKDFINFSRKTKLEHYKVFHLQNYVAQMES